MSKLNIIRNIKNPIIKISDIKPSDDNFEVIGVFNCAVTTYKNEVILLLRVAERVIEKNNHTGVPYYDIDKKQISVKYFDRTDKSIDYSDPRWIKTKDSKFLTSISHFKIAKSNDGVHFEINQEPWLVASDYYESYGIEDPRITLIEDTYYINYTAVSESGTVTKLVSTKDFVTVKSHGVIFQADNKDVAIFPEKINGNYYALNRPTSGIFGIPEMWIAKSKDLVAFYDHQVFAKPRKNHFDSARIGASCVPFKTEKGWVEIYHGATLDNFYCLGAMLLDLNDPTKIIKWLEEPIMIPEASYEVSGFMPNVVFACGCYVKDDIIHLYYGAADDSICHAEISLKELLRLF